jgi:hypothetical protein
MSDQPAFIEVLEFQTSQKIGWRKEGGELETG